MTDRPIRILIVEDHLVVAEGLELALGRYEDLLVVGSAVTADDAERLTLERDPHVVLMDHHLPDRSGAEAAAAVRRAKPHLAVVMLTADTSDETMIAALEAGACGYLLKTRPSSEIVTAIRRAAEGEFLFPADKLSRLFAIRRSKVLAADEQPALTAREREILELMGQGLDNAAIAERLVIGVNTVRHHVQNILEKLRVHSKLEAVARAYEVGLLEH
jgi:DNA-binding NarL/FixJ family response regulator